MSGDEPAGRGFLPERRVQIRDHKTGRYQLISEAGEILETSGEPFPGVLDLTADIPPDVEEAARGVRGTRLDPPLPEFAEAIDERSGPGRRRFVAALCGAYAKRTIYRQVDHAFYPVLAEIAWRGLDALDAADADAAADAAFELTREVERILDAAAVQEREAHYAFQLLASRPAGKREVEDVIEALHRKFSRDRRTAQRRIQDARERSGLPKRYDKNRR